MLLYKGIFLLLCPVSSSQVKLVEQGVGYLVLGGLITASLALLPFSFRLAQHLGASSLSSLSLTELRQMAVGPHDFKSYTFFFITTVQRICLTGLFFFMMCVAERTYKQVSEIFCCWNHCLALNSGSQNFSYHLYRCIATLLLVQ